MAGTLKVDTAELLRASADIGVAQEELAAAHGQSVTNVGSAGPGLVGQSAQAIASMAGKWQTISASQQKAIAKYADHLDYAAKMFTHMEENNAEKLKEVGEQVV